MTLTKFLFVVSGLLFASLSCSIIQLEEHPLIFGTYLGLGLLTFVSALVVLFRKKAKPVEVSANNEYPK